MRWRQITWLDEATKPPTPVAEVTALVGQNLRSPRANKGQNDWRTGGGKGSGPSPYSKSMVSPSKILAAAGSPSLVKGVTQKEDGR